jgi:hypothetical protein
VCGPGFATSPRAEDGLTGGNRGNRENAQASVALCFLCYLLFKLFASCSTQRLEQPKIRSGLLRRGQHVVDRLRRLSGTGHAGRLHRDRTCPTLTNKQLETYGSNFCGTGHLTSLGRAALPTSSKPQPPATRSCGQRAKNPVRTLSRAATNGGPDGPLQWDGTYRDNFTTIELVPP